MFYSLEVAVPPNTTEKGYQVDHLSLTKGKVIKISVFFPWGCGGLCRIQIIRGTWQVFPLTRAQWLRGNKITIEGETDIDITTAPFEFEVHSWNEDDTFTHHPIVYVQMIKGDLPAKVLQLFDFLR